jgi:molybdopterin-guanine dinucleotide biosynthesis protein A
MTQAGYVLAGGNSSRMGTDKALLERNGITMAQQVAESVRRAAGSVTLIGDPARYGALGLRTIPDHRTGCGPLGGIEAALMDSVADWNLIVACDMPSLSPGLLTDLCAEAARLDSGADCLIPRGPDGGPQPLCGVYRGACLGAVSTALDRGVRKVLDLVASLRVHFRDVHEPDLFQNLNTPLDWTRYLGGRTPE